MNEILTRLVEVANQGVEDVYLNNPVESQLLDAFMGEALTQLGYPVPQDYLTFLRVCNGAQIGNVIFLEAQELVPLTIDAGYTGCLILGLSGNHTEFVFEAAVGHYRAINLGHRDEILSSYDGFYDLLGSVMNGVAS